MSLEKLFSFFGGIGSEGAVSVHEFAKGVKKLNGGNFNLTDVRQAGDRLLKRGQASADRSLALYDSLISGT
jgi:hypothetical protein